MEITEIIRTSVIVLVLVVLASASVSDWRKREVSDVHWAIIGFVGLAVSFIVSSDASTSWKPIVNLLSGTLMLLSVLGYVGKADVLSETVAAVLAVFVIVHSDGDMTYIGPAMSVLFCGIYHVMYSLSIVRGGADAKCLMTLGIALPGYTEPVLAHAARVPVLLELAIPPSFAVLFMASVLSVVGCSLFCLLKNRGSGISWSRRFRIYPMPLEDVGGKHVWPVQKIENGSCVPCGIMDDSDVPTVLGGLRSAGIGEVEVTPMVPFIVPATISFILVVLFGNPMFIL